jgi:hypothetical protein
MMAMTSTMPTANSSTPEAFVPSIDAIARSSHCGSGLARSTVSSTTLIGHGSSNAAPVSAPTATRPRSKMPQWPDSKPRTVARYVFRSSDGGLSANLCASKKCARYKYATGGPWTQHSIARARAHACSARSSRSDSDRSAQLATRGRSSAAATLATSASTVVGSDWQPTPAYSDDSAV